MSGSWHVVVRLPDGRVAWANHTEPVVPAMRQINRAVGAGKPRPAEAEAEVRAWLDANHQQSETCRNQQCGHRP